MPKFKDPVIAKLAAKYGPIKSLPSQDIFADLVESIVSQQLSGKAASTIFSRVAKLLKTVTPKNLLATSDQSLRNCGLSWSKVSYVKDLALKSKAGTLHLLRLDNLSDEEVINHLVAVKGIGRWTAEMILMFSLSRPDILPLDDLGIQNAMIRLYNLQHLRTMNSKLKTRMQEIASLWRPHRTLACRYLWKSLDNE